MKFRVIHTAETYQKEGKEQLEKLGFKFDLRSDKQGRVLNTWYEERKNYPEPGEYDREVQEKDVVVIEFNTIEELTNFANEYGDLVIRPIEGALPIIEIYDDYRE